MAIEVKNTSSGKLIDYLAQDYESLLESMRRVIPDKMPLWTEFEKETDFGNVLLQAFAHMGDILAYYQDRKTNECFLTTARERRNIIQHLRLISYQLSTATPASATLTLEINSNVTDVVRISKGDAFATKSSRDAASVRFEYVGEDFDLDCSTLSIDMATDKKYFEIPIEEGKLIKEDVLGTSDGEADQRFALSFPRLILRSIGSSGTVNIDIRIWTDLGGVIDEQWRLQESLAFSSADAGDYTIEIDENDRATIVFGGNGFGAVVATGATVKAHYRVGGGKLGNVSANSINTIVDAPGLNIIGAKVYNKDAATGGAERESIAHAVKQAPSVFRSLNRAVTAADYEALALKFNGVGKVRAEIVNWNRVTLYIAPAGGGRVSDILKANLLAYFEDKRPMSTVIEVEDVDFVKIYVSAQVGIESYYAKADMQEKVEKAVADILSFDNVDFGEIIYLSKIYESIEDIEGIRFVTIDEFRRDGLPGPEDDAGKIKLYPSEIPRLPGISVDDSVEDQAYMNGLKFVGPIEGGY